MSANSSSLPSVSAIVDEVHLIANIKHWLNSLPRPVSTPSTPRSTPSASAALDMGSPYYLSALPVGTDKNTSKKLPPVVLSDADQKREAPEVEDPILRLR